MEGKRGRQGPPWRVMGPIETEGDTTPGAGRRRDFHHGLLDSVNNPREIESCFFVSGSLAPA